MQLTSLGMVIVPMSIVCLFLPIRYYIGLTLVSSVFQSAAVFSLGENYVNPFLYLSAMLIVKGMITIVWRKQYALRIPAWSFYFVALMLWAIVVIWYAPKVYGDIPILTSSWYRTYSSLEMVAASKSYTNLISLLIYFLALLVIYNYEKEISLDMAYGVTRMSVAIVLVIGFTYIAARNLNIGVDFLNGLIFSDNESVQTNSIEALTAWNKVRFYGPYKEGSYCGGFLAPVFVAMFNYEKKSKVDYVWLGLCAIAIVLNSSSTGLVVLICGMGITLLVNRRASRKVKVVVGCVIGTLVAVVGGYMPRIIELIFRKSVSSSGIQRTLMNKNCFNAFVESKFLGVGINNVRGSSFLINMLGQIGIIGITLLVFAIYKIAKGNKKVWAVGSLAEEQKYALTFGGMSLIAQILSEPDLFLSTFWFSLMLLILTQYKICKNYANLHVVH